MRSNRPAANRHFRRLASKQGERTYEILVGVRHGRAREEALPTVVLVYCLFPNGTPLNRRTPNPP